MTNPQISIEDQLVFLKECHRAAWFDLARAFTGIQIDRARRATIHIKATIDLLQSILQAEKEMPNISVSGIAGVGDGKYLIVRSCKDEDAQNGMDGSG